MMANIKLRLSYNCRGWNSGKYFLDPDFLNNYDICLIQEHWLLPEQLSLLDIDPNFCSFGVSAIDSSRILTGRPYGGCGFLIRNSILNMVTRIDSNSSRFCAISINSNSLVTLLVCVYLPTNYGTHDSDDLFQQTLSEISGFLDSCCYDNVIIAGDFNVDFKRNSSFLSHLQLFMSDLNLTAVDISFAQQIDFTYEHDDGLVRYWPDHVLILSHFMDTITDIRCIHSACNFSDHSPLSFNISQLICFRLKKFYLMVCSVFLVTSSPSVIVYTILVMSCLSTLMILKTSIAYLWI